MCAGVMHSTLLCFRSLHSVFAPSTSKMTVGFFGLLFLLGPEFAPAAHACIVSPIQFLSILLLEERVPGPRSQPVSDGTLTRWHPEWGHLAFAPSPPHGRFLLFPNWCLCCSVFNTHTEKVLNTEQSVQKVVEQRSQ